MEALHYIGKVRQGGLIVAEDTGRVLVTRDSRSEKWELPGGRLHSGEIPVEGFRREIREELGIEITVRRILHTELMLHEHTGTETFFVMYEASIPTEAMSFIFDPVEVAEIRWIDKESSMTLNLYADAQGSIELYFQTLVPHSH